MTTGPCPFCPPDPGRVFLQGRTVFALWDAFPVNPGHAPAGYNIVVTGDGTDQVGGQRIKGQRPTHRLAAARSDVGAPSTSRGPGPS
jgi:hypothetical protein